MQVEHVAGIGFTAGRTAQDKRHFTVCHSLFAKVVEHHQGMTSGVAEILPDGGAGKGRIILQGGRICSRCRHHDGIVHRSLFPQRLHDGSHGGALLPHCDIDTVHRIALEIALALVDYGVQGYGRLAGLPVADNELSLAASNGNHGVYCLEACLQGLMHRLTEYHSGSLAFQRHAYSLALHLAQTIERGAYRIHYASHQAFSDIDSCNTPKPSDPHVFFHLVGGAQQDCSDAVFLEVHDDSLDAAVEFQQFAGFGLGQAVYTGHTVADGEHAAHLFVFYRHVDTLQLPVEYV